MGYGEVSAQRMTLLEELFEVCGDPGSELISLVSGEERRCGFEVL